MFKKASLLILALILLSYTANAQRQAEVTKSDAWELGASLSAAAIANAINHPASEINELFNKSQKSADKFSIKLPSLPAKTTIRAEYTQRLIDYFVKEGGHPVQKYLKENFSEAHAAVFDLSLATNIYFFLQLHGDPAQAETYSPLLLIMLEDRTEAAKLPVQTTEELVKLDGKKPTWQAVKSIVFNTIFDVSLYLMKQDKMEIGDRLTAQEKYSEAIVQYTKVIEGDPNFAEAYLQRGEAHYLSKDYGAAIADFTKFISFADKNSLVGQRLPEVYGNRCISYYHKKDYVMAEKDCTAGINIKKDYASAYYFRAQSRLAQDKIAGAIGDFTKALETKPSAVIYYHRGAAYQKIGKEDLAKLDFEKAESLEPGIVQKF